MLLQMHDPSAQQYHVVSIALFYQQSVIMIVLDLD